jgi:hypothetical protein
VPKYEIKPPANLSSKFLLETELRKVREKEEEKKKHEAERRLAIEVSKNLSPIGGRGGP